MWCRRADAEVDCSRRCACVLIGGTRRGIRYRKVPEHLLLIVLPEDTVCWHKADCGLASPTGILPEHVQGAEVPVYTRVKTDPLFQVPGQRELSSIIISSKGARATRVQSRPHAKLRIVVEKLIMSRSPR